MTDHTPKPKPRKGETQQENESRFEYELNVKGLNIDSTNEDPNYIVSDTDGTVTNSEGITLTFPSSSNVGAGFELDSPEDDGYTTDGVTIASGPTYFTGTNVSVTEGFMTSEQEHEKLREKYPALKKGYDHYRTLLKLAENGPEDLDN